MTVLMKPPTGTKNLLFKDRAIATASIIDGMVSVPNFAVDEAKRQGFEFADKNHALAKSTAPIDMKAALAEAQPHELANFLMVSGADHKRWDKNTHVYADHMRERISITCPHCQESHVVPSDGELFTDGPEHTIGLKTTQGSLDFEVIRDEKTGATNDQNLMLQMKITSDNLPPGTRVDTIRRGRNPGDKAVGTLKLPQGAGIDQIKTGIDMNAKVIISVAPEHISEMLNDYHGRFHENGPGRVVFLSPEQMVAKAHEILDAEETKANGGIALAVKV